MFKIKEGENYNHRNTLKYFEDYNLSLTQKLSKIASLGQPSRELPEGAVMPNLSFKNRGGIMFRFSVLLTSVFFFLGGICYASDYGFETTSEGITKGLLTPKEDRDGGSWDNAGQSLGTPDSPPVKTRSIKVLKKKEGVEVWETITAPEERRGGFVNLKIQFDVNSYTLRPGSSAILYELGKALSGPDLQHLSIYINGHTDSDGKEKYNLRLSLNRASTVKKYLIDYHAIYPDRLKVVGYGESMPLKPNTSAKNKQLNRRVEIVVAD